VSGEPVFLHPGMTLRQMAAWCAVHKREAHISWRIVNDELVPCVSALPAPPDVIDDMEELGQTRLGMAWWNALTEPERAQALLDADSPVPAQAWHHFKLLQRMRGIFGEPIEGRDFTRVLDGG
jgi:hypothetical protein